MVSSFSGKAARPRQRIGHNKMIKCYHTNSCNRFLLKRRVCRSEFAELGHKCASFGDPIGEGAEARPRLLEMTSQKYLIEFKRVQKQLLTQHLQSSSVLRTCNFDCLVL